MNLKQIPISAYKEYKQRGLLSLVSKGFRFVGHTVDESHGYSQEHGTNVFEFSSPETTVQIHTIGLGDIMITRQFGRAFHDYCLEYGDPELGDVTIAGGAMEPALHPEPGDINLWWWWSFGQYDDRPRQSLDHYLNETTVDPDVILCLSEPCLDEAEQAGYETLYFPLGTQAFEPLGFDRSGLGYAGSEGHKEDSKEQLIFGSFAQPHEFEWVSHFVYPEQLNLWYNQKLITFGLHKEGQRQWGMVNNRVFETLASGTPFILEEHPYVEDVLGFEFPYQVSSPDEARQMVADMRGRPQEVISEFREYSETVRAEHSYDTRISELIEFLR